MNKNKIVGISLFLVMILNVPLLADTNWRVTKNEKGIKVENREVPGSRMDETRAECIVDAPIEVLLEVMRNHSSWANWFGNCKERMLVKKIDDFNEVVYHAISLPFPFVDREVVGKVSYKIKEEPGEILIQTKTIGAKELGSYGVGQITEKKGRKKVSKFKSKIVLKKLDQKKTKVVYQAHAEAGVSMPTWLINNLSSQQPYSTLKELRKECKKDKYYQRENALCAINSTEG